MPALASLEELKATQKQIQGLKEQYPEACQAVVDLLKKNRKIGYKNICRMFTEEATPEKLKQAAPTNRLRSYPAIEDF